MTTTTHAGSAACYKRGCRQPACLREGRRYSKHLAYDVARGISRRHDATQVRIHIERLTAHNWNHRQIAQAAGIPRSTVTSLAAGQQQTGKRIALAILSVPIGPAPADPTRVDATGTTRRIRALAAIGHTLVSLSRRLNMTEDRLTTIACGLAPVVRATEAQRIATAYRQLAAIPGPSVRARNDARKKGWHGPLAWGDIDDPNAQPEIDAHADKRGRPAQVDTARVARLTREGLSAEQIAREIGCHERTVIRARGRARELGMAA